MKALVALSFVMLANSAAFAQDSVGGPILVDPDFGLTFETPAGFEADMVGQTPEGLVLITVSTTNPGLQAVDANVDLCDITFQYNPAYGQGDQAWVNALVDGTGFYETMAKEVIVPGTVESSVHFDHRGSSAHQFFGTAEMGAAFTVAAIPSPEGFVLVTCVSEEPLSGWDMIDPVIAAITLPGQQRDHLVARGSCKADFTAIRTRLEQTGAEPFTAETIAALDSERNRIAEACDGFHAETIMDDAMAEAGLSGSYRTLRYDALARIGADLLTDEQHAALDEGRLQVVATSDEATGERYLRYMHFIVGLRSIG